MVRKNKVEAVCKEIQFAGCYVVDTQGHGAGLALLWKNEGGVEIKGNCNHYIDFEVACDQVVRWRYTGFYGCPERSRRKESWSMLKELAAKSSIPWCVIGDFNDMMFMQEKKGGRLQPRSLLEGFKDTVYECGLMDLGYVGSEFTWEKVRGSASWVQEHLDRGLSNHGWKIIFPQAEVKVVDVSSSDHLPLFLQLNKKVYTPKKRRFRFENMWIRESECFGLVQSCWNTTAAQNIIEKLQFCSIKLEEWGGGRVKEMSTKLKQCRMQLKQYRSRRDVYGVKKYDEVRWEFLKLLEQQEVYCKQRAKQFWLREGDQNSKFFHNFASGRRKNNSLKGLEDKNGVWKDDNAGMQEIIVDYFSELFQALPCITNLSERESVQKVTEEQNDNLSMPIMSDEVKRAVDSMHPEKSPGCDGLNPGFYQAYWSIVGQDVVKFCQFFFTTGELPAGINDTIHS